MKNKTTKEMTMQEIEKALGCKVKIVAKKVKVTAKRARKRLADIPVGETFKIGPFEFIVLEHDYEYGTSVLLKDCWKYDEFDNDSNNYAESKVRSDLNNEFYNQLVSLIGEDNIIEHVVDLTTDDGRENYLWCNDYVSLLTVDLYKEHAHIINRYITDDPWWLATAYSALKNYRRIVRCVSNDGTLSRNSCDLSNLGVRPFCTLNPYTKIS